MKQQSRIHLLTVSLVVSALCAIAVLASSPVALAQQQSGLSISAGLAQTGEPRFFAIKDARIVPVSGPVIEKGTVVVANGIITAVGTDVTIPPEAAVVDGTGLTVYPGLIDAGATVGLTAEENAGPAGGRGRGPRSATPAKIYNGPQDRPQTTPWVVAADELNPNDPRIQNWRNAGFTTALVEPEGGIFPGQGSVVDLGDERAGNMVVSLRATLGIDFQLSGNFASFPSSLMGAVSYVRQVFIDTRWYQNAEDVYNAHQSGIERPPYDRTEVVVGNALKNNELVLLPAGDKLAIYRAIRLAKEWQIRAAMYGAQEGYSLSNEIAASKLPVFVNVNWPKMEKGADEDALTLRELRLWDRAPSTPAALSKAGVTYAFYSGGLSNPKDILKNVKKAIDAGLSADDALKAMTVNPAQMLGVADRLGSIEQGKIANLVVTDGDLFGEKTKIKDVFVDGMRYEVHEEAPPGPPGGKSMPMQQNNEGVQQ